MNAPEPTKFEDIREQVLASRGPLRAFAISLSGNGDRADDLVQETMSLAIRYSSKFQLGTSVQAWLFTILRNRFRSDYRKRKREVDYRRGEDEEFPSGYENDVRLSAGGEHDEICRLDYALVEKCLEQLPDEQREAVELVILDGMEYEYAAASMGCAVGTVKSRVNRGRLRLIEMLGDLYKPAPKKQNLDEALALRQVLEASELDDFAFEED